MNNIAFYSVTDTEKNQLKYVSSKVKADFYHQKLTLKNLPPSATEILAIHVDCPITEDILKKLPNLKLIVTRTAGFDHIDLKAAAKAGVKVINCAGLNAISVAEFVFGLILNWYRDFPKALEDGRKLHFQNGAVFGHELNGKTLGIVGTGSIGSSVARIARGFGMNLIGFDSYKNKDLAKETGLKYAVSLEQLCKKSDIVTLHVPAIASTNKMVSAKLLKQFKPGALLVNTARGAVVDTAALYKALEHGKLSGYVTDVLEFESIPKDSKKITQAQAKVLDIQKNLAKLPNVLLTPHTAHATLESTDRIFRHTFELIEGFQKGQKINFLN